MVDFPTKNNGVWTLLQKSAGFQGTCEHMLQDPRILHDFREALGGTQGYVLQLHGFPWRILLRQDPRIL